MKKDKIRKFTEFETLEIMDEDLGKKVDEINNSFLRLKNSIYHFVALLSFGTILVASTEAVFSLYFYAPAVIMLLLLVYAKLKFADAKVKLRICIVFLEGMEVLDDNNRYVYEKHLNRLKPQEYLPSWLNDLIY